LAPPDDVVMTAALPPALREAQSEAEAVLEKFDRLSKVLMTTHTAIPEALAMERQLSAELGAGEITGGDVGALRSRLAEVTSGREAGARQRSAAAEGVLDLEAALAGARAQVGQAESTFAATIAGQFMERWRRAVDALAAMYSEGLALADALHVKVDLESALRRALPTGPAPTAAAASLPPVVARVADVVQKLDAGIALCGGIRQAKEVESRAWSLAQVRRVPYENPGTYRALRPIHSPTDGLQFPAGTLVDASLLGHGFLGRLATARHIVPVELESAHRAG
jgi:hypothetical protein